MRLGLALVLLGAVFVICLLLLYCRDFILIRPWMFVTAASQLAKLYIINYFPFFDKKSSANENKGILGMAVVQVPGVQRKKTITNQCTLGKFGIT